ncbi:MAG: Orange carotenoid protein [Spirulina sp. DLM2.Bin59]|nr:MAG: Orange carotenoid protein [Spirulina sp. DLM2.Bin59]
MTYSISRQAAFPELANAVATTTEQIKRLGPDDQLALLWFAYKQLGRSMTPAAPGAARLEFAQGLLDEFKAMNYEQQMTAMRNLVNRINDPIGRAYGILSTNTKLAFWFVLSELMVAGTVIPVPDSYIMSPGALRAFKTLENLEFNQQITVFRNVVAPMGFDPFA